MGNDDCTEAVLAARREIKEGGRARCTKPVSLNTGFGGEARQVKNHHPAG